MADNDDVDDINNANDDDNEVYKLSWSLVLDSDTTVNVNDKILREIL